MIYIRCRSVWDNTIAAVWSKETTKMREKNYTSVISVYSFANLPVAAHGYSSYITVCAWRKIPRRFSSKTVNNARFKEIFTCDNWCSNETPLVKNGKYDYAILFNFLLINLTSFSLKTYSPKSAMVFVLCKNTLLYGRNRDKNVQRFWPHDD